MHGELQQLRLQSKECATKYHERLVGPLSLPEHVSWAARPLGDREQHIVEIAAHAAGAGAGVSTAVGLGAASKSVTKLVLTALAARTDADVPAACRIDTAIEGLRVRASRTSYGVVG